MALETERLILDTWEITDWKSFRPVATDPEVMRYITGGIPWSDEQIQSFVERQIRCYSERGFCRWRLLDKASGQMIGFCGVGFWKDAGDPEIGWWLARPWWRRGLAAEAARAALQDAFDRVGLERIISVAMPENIASTRVMEKLGLVRECEFESDGVKLVRYAIGREQYLRRAAGSP
jgi:ribosomal-protein-alanine N-acetyltransferase